MNSNWRIIYFIDLNQFISLMKQLLRLNINNSSVFVEFIKNISDLPIRTTKLLKITDFGGFIIFI